MKKFLLYAVCLLASLANAQIKHVIYIVQENRPFNDYFGTFPGVQGGPHTVGFTSSGSAQALSYLSPYWAYGGCKHTHNSSLSAINGGSMNGFDNVFCASAPSAAICTGRSANPGTACTHPGQADTAECGVGGMCTTAQNGVSYQYFDGHGIPYYWFLARTFGLADNLFSSVSGPSYPNHQYIFAGASHTSIDNAAGTNGSPGTWNCDWSLQTGSTPPFTYAAGVGTQSPTVIHQSTSPGFGITGFSRSGTTFTFQTGDQSLVAGQTVQLSGFTNDGETYFNTYGGVVAGSGEVTVLSAGLTVNQFEATITGYSGPTSGMGLVGPTGAPSCTGGTVGCICPNITTLSDELDTAGLSWRVYGAPYSDPGYIWNAPSYFQHIRYNSSGGNGPDWSNVYTEPQLLYDIENDQLPTVGWLFPTLGTSEHDYGTYGVTVHEGEMWTEQFIDAMFRRGQDDWVIFVTWDDFGGFYDWVNPYTPISALNVSGSTATITWGGASPFVSGQPISIAGASVSACNATFTLTSATTFNVGSSGCTTISGTAYATEDYIGHGIRVPFLCIGPFCKNQVDHTLYEFASVNAYIESLCSVLGSTSCANLGTREQYATSIGNMISTGQTPIHAPMRGFHQGSVLQGFVQ